MNKKSGGCRAAGVVLALAWAFATLALAQEFVDRARELMRQGKAAEAYALLEPRADELRDADSVYLFGIAALDSGQAGLSIIAFERALALNPNHVVSRAELVRALVAVGDTDQARVELARIRTADVPPEVRPKLEKLALELAKATDVARRQNRGVSGYMDADIGYDSNINTGANSRVVSVPLFAGATFTLNRVYEKAASTFGALGGGLYLYDAINSEVRAFATVDAKARYNFREENYYPSYWTGSAGLRYQKGDTTATVALTQLENWISTYKVDDQMGLYGSWQRFVNPNNEVGFYGQILDQKRPIQRTLDSRLYLGGVGWRHAFGGEGTPVASLSGFLGDDREKGTDPTVGRRVAGVRAGFERQLPFGARLVTSLTFQRSIYGGQNIFFFNTRRDDRLDATAGLVFTPAKDWSVTPQFAYTRNKSNIPVVDFERVQLFVNIRRNLY